MKNKGLIKSIIVLKRGQEVLDLTVEGGDPLEEFPKKQQQQKNL